MLFYKVRLFLSSAFTFLYKLIYVLNNEQALKFLRVSFKWDILGLRIGLFAGRMFPLFRCLLSSASKFEVIECQMIDYKMIDYSCTVHVSVCFVMLLSLSLSRKEEFLIYMYSISIYKSLLIIYLTASCFNKIY